VSDTERIWLWLVTALATLACCLLSFFHYKLAAEHRDLRVAFLRLQENQESQNKSLKGLASATETQLQLLRDTTSAAASKIGNDVSELRQQVGKARATKDPNTGTVIWD
jgi:hypothetical protein